MAQPSEEEMVETLQEEYLKTMQENFSTEAKTRTQAASNELGQVDQKTYLAQLEPVQYRYQDNNPVTSITGGRQADGSSKLTVVQDDGRTVEMVRQRVPVPVQKDNSVVDVRQGMLLRDTSESSFNFDAKISQIRAMPDGNDKQDLANVTIGVLQDAEIARKGMIRNIAAQKAGVNAAQDALTLAIAEERQAKAKGIMPPTGVSIRVHSAQQALNAAQIVANQQEKDMEASDPIIGKTKSQVAMLGRLMDLTARNMQQNFARGENDRIRDENKEQEIRNKLPPIGPNTLNNFALAYDLARIDPDKPEQAKVQKSVLEKALSVEFAKDPKGVNKLINIDKLNAVNAISDPDTEARTRALRVVIGHELAQLGKTDTLPKYIRDLEKLATDPTVFMTPEQKMAYNREVNNSKGNVERSAVRQKYISDSIESFLKEFESNRFNNIASWTLSAPGLREAVDTLKAKSKDGRVLARDAYKLYMDTEIKAPGTDTAISSYDKINMVIKDLVNTINNRPKSLILPDATDITDVYVTEAKNALGKAFLSSGLGLMRFK